MRTQFLSLLVTLIISSVATAQPAVPPHLTGDEAPFGVYDGDPILGKTKMTMWANHAHTSIRAEGDGMNAVVWEIRDPKAGPMNGQVINVSLGGPPLVALGTEEPAYKLIVMIDAPAGKPITTRCQVRRITADGTLEFLGHVTTVQEGDRTRRFDVMTVKKGEEGQKQLCAIVAALHRVRYDLVQAKAVQENGFSSKGNPIVAKFSLAEERFLTDFARSSDRIFVPSTKN